MEEAGQHILGHGAGIPMAARGGDDDIAAPEIPAQQVARPGRELVEPAQARRPGPEIQRKRKAAEDDLGAGQQLVALLARADRSRTRAEVALHRPRRPGLAELDVKPAPSIDHMQASVDRRDPTQRVVGYRHDHQDFSGQHPGQVPGLSSGARARRHGDFRRRAHRGSRLATQSMRSILTRSAGARLARHDWGCMHMHIIQPASE